MKLAHTCITTNVTLKCGYQSKKNFKAQTKSHTEKPISSSK